ncbi:MAG: DUF2167 domain-containing protein [Flavobacteriales bacterium]|nr:DUF2167 domain-containing protein [Flavobacteriales bacterium]
MSLALNIILAARMALPFEFAETEDTTTLDTSAMDVEAMIQQYQDSTIAAFNYQRGTVQLENGVASLVLPAGFKFLGQEQGTQVVKDLWGNRDAEGILGVIFPENDDPFSDSSYAYVIQYDESGYVEDDDADDIDYDEMLAELQKDEAQNNQQRSAMGMEPMYLIGWAAPPFYDQERKVLHWAKEIKFGDSAEVNTLNYNVRVLGRKGVLILNAVAAMSELEMVKQHVPEVLNIVQFNDGYKYEQFDSSVDKVAAYTIGGLVAGKVLAKVGIFAGLAKFGKVIILAIAAAIGGLWKLITGRKKKDEEVPPATTYKP